MQPEQSCPPGGSDPQIESLAGRHVMGSRLHLAELLADEEAGRIALVSSFGAESAVLIHMVCKASPETPILFIDTGKHFAETYRYVEILSEALQLRNVQYLRPDPRLITAEDPDGRLWCSNPNMCCTIRKSFALQDALVDFNGWISGRKRFQGGLRANLPFLERDGRHIKINPLIHHTPSMIRAYFAEHDLPLHPLLERGYQSIGCEPCTMPVQDGQDARAGRWSGLDKVECGIHLGPDGSFSRAKAE